uniref:Reelin domain-containing protein n=1 Tax=Anopheles maculatus TaxID=74869 RepID=A0A182SJA1_9DIPT
MSTVQYLNDATFRIVAQSEVSTVSIWAKAFRRSNTSRKTMITCKLLVVCAFCVAGSSALSLVVSQEQSYFFGTKPADNLLCYSKTITKGSALPASISYTNANDKKINFVTMNADKYSVLGYTVDKTDGQLGTPAIGYRINGPSPLTYAITIDMFCAP